MRRLVLTWLVLWLLALPAHRSAQLADLPRPPGRMTTEVSLPSPDVAARTAVPQRSMLGATPSPSGVVEVKRLRSTVTSPSGAAQAGGAAFLPALPSAGLAGPPSAAGSPRPTGTLIAGIATWFASPQNVSAAGPALRRALGPGWRGFHVRVCSGGRCAVTVISDWCACGPRGGTPTVIDLDDDVFRRLAPLSRGVLHVTIGAVPAPPATSTEAAP